MFASEKVMLEYLGQLLNEELPKTPAEVMDKSVDEAVNSAINLKPGKLKPISSERQFPSSNLREEKSVARTPPTPKIQAKSVPKTELKRFKEPEPVEPSTEAKAVEKLLQQVSIKQQEEKIAKEQSKVVDLVETEVTAQATPQAVPTVVEKEQAIPEEAFQALFFQVAGLVLAVPLQELGGIHNLGEINTLFGKPSWFHGVMLHRNSKLNVVDSAQWVMPEKYDKAMEESLNYQYLIMLGESKWGLAAETLVETELIQPGDVKWRSQPGKRPWLLGTIKEKMCALLHVGDLIAMLEQGINARQE